MLVVKFSRVSNNNKSITNKSFGYAGKRDKFHQASSLELKKDMSREKQSKAKQNATRRIKTDKVEGKKREEPQQ